ncbi:MULTISPECIES: HEAT repeat domain-containing protein [Aerosakkonema]|uniref:HEAT repeat domain-containing protein n=1 Tax=Aerosakkonema TaxID=1246629 RepID=UPI0035B90A6A
MMMKVLEQATIAAKQENWTLLNQYLSQMLERKNLLATDVTRLLDWALEILTEGDFQERWDVAKVFPSLGDRAIAPLIAILKDEEAEEELRWFVPRILAEFDSPEAVTALVEILKTSQTEELSAMAAEALANLGQSAQKHHAFRFAIAALTDLLAAEETRLLAVRSLSHIRRSEIVTPLLGVVKDKQISVRAAAIEALSSFHDSRIPPVLLNALKDVAAPVRREAIIGLGLRSDLQKQLNLVSQIVPLLWDFNPEVCAAAASTLGRLGTDAAADALFQVLSSPLLAMSLQLQCVRSLSWIETPKALAHLQAALTFAPIAIYQEIVTVLGRVEQPHLAPDAASILIDALKSQHPLLQDSSVKQALAISLGQLKHPQAIHPLIEMLADPDLGVRLHATAALKKFPTALVQLQQLAANENLTQEWKQGIAIALQEF